MSAFVAGPSGLSYFFPNVRMDAFKKGGGRESKPFPRVPYKPRWRRQEPYLLLAVAVYFMA